MRQNQPLLLIEDNEDDRFFFKRALKAAGVSNPLFVAEDGQKAIDYLSGTGVFGDRERYPVPSLVLLDLNLPEIKGLEVLSWLKQQDSLRRVVTVVLTSSREPSDVRKAYQMGANSYLVKPSTSGQLEDLVKTLDEYWLQFNVFDK
jgi:CheY-like chemotaxis protein